jgi:uncharacterized membrane protein (DUF485 family)
VGIDSYRILFKKTNSFATYVTIHTFPIYVVVNNRDQFFINSEIIDVNTRHSSNIHLPLANLGIY